MAQVVALSLGLTALLLLTVTRGDLLASWHRALPADAPNRFVINIQPEQRQAVGAFLRAGGLPVTLAPMAYLAPTRVNLELTQERFPLIQFHTTRELTVTLGADA